MTVRSLTSGVSGMLANQQTMDVSANNVANAETPGFKGSRVTFSTNLVQTLTSGSAPGGAVGGRNPNQIGLGVQANSIELDMAQGALQATGRTLDLAIQGAGFLEVTDGTRSFYSRVGNLGIDANNDLVHLGTGFRVIGNTYNLTQNPDGTQTINAVSVPLNVPVEDAFPPQRTEVVEFQGNLSSDTPALRGSSLQGLYQMRDEVSGNLASENTLLRNLDTFVPVSPIPPSGTTRTVFVYGTKPSGETYAASFELHPWDDPVVGDNQGTLGELVEQINNSLNQGGSRFGTVRLENGSLVANGVGSGDGFAMFIGEGDATYDLSGAAPAVNPTAINPIADVVTMPNSGGSTLSGSFASNGVAGNIDTYLASSTTAPEGRGLVEPMFYFAAGTTLTSDITVSVRKNSLEVGVITIPAGVYGAGPVSDRTFRLQSLPHMQPGDTLSYELVGSDLAGAANTINFTTFLIPDSDPDNLTADSFGGGANGIPDMFEENSTTDANAWQYANSTNTTFNWHRTRFVPEFVSSSIEVFDAQGGSHILEARYFRTGTRTEAGTGARFNSWDMVVGIPHGEGELIDDVVAGLEFDQAGRYTGNVGTSAHGTALTDSNFVGNPSVSQIRIDWASTGPTDPTDIRINVGEPGTFNGLTGFGSTSTAAAIDQNGFPDGRLDSLSVSSEGDIIALYTNGISRRLAQLTLSTFRNPAGMLAIEGNLWQQTTNSGNPTRRIAGSNAGFLSSGALEGSNVDIATEFSRMIVAQRGFQVNARVIQTTDSMLEELANLLR